MRVVRTQGRGGKLTRQMLSDLEQRGAGIRRVPCPWCSASWEMCARGETGLSPLRDEVGRPCAQQALEVISI